MSSLGVPFLALRLLCASFIKQIVQRHCRCETVRFGHFTGQCQKLQNYAEIVNLSSVMALERSRTGPRVSEAVPLYRSLEEELRIDNRRDQKCEFTGDVLKIWVSRKRCLVAPSAWFRKGYRFGAKVLLWGPI
jgi:hypothetical protein